MEIDPPTHESEGEEWDEMETEEADEAVQYQNLLGEAMEYGQVLMREYRDERREYGKTLEDIFSLIAYDDAPSSVHGHLLDPAGRVTVAEELNSAILGMFGWRDAVVDPARIGADDGAQSRSVDLPPPHSNVYTSRRKPWWTRSVTRADRRHSSI